MSSQRAGFGGMPDSVRELFGCEALRLMRARRGGEKGGVTIVQGDIDHFKNGNDTYGRHRGRSSA
jgi:GGDEF domain-containing protein